MDSDSQLSDDEEARLYALLYYVDSSTSKHNTNIQDTYIKYQSQQIARNSYNIQKPSTPQSLTVDVIVDGSDKVPEGDTVVATPVSTSVENDNQCNVELDENIIADKTKKKISLSRRYWADNNRSEGSGINVRTQSRYLSKKRANKHDKTIVTLVNTRGLGKRKSSEGSLPDDNNADCNTDGMVSSKKSVTKSHKPTFATPTTISTSTRLKIHKISSTTTKNTKNASKVTPRDIRNRNLKVSAPSSHITGKQSSLIQKLLSSINTKSKKVKNPFAGGKSESILIESSEDDDDSVVEVKLPDPRHATIELDSSDESQTENHNAEPAIAEAMSEQPPQKRVATSPVPSIVSSTSDDFIQADCSSLNITSGANSGPVFNFRLHGSEFSDAQFEVDANTGDKAGKSNSEQQCIVTSSSRLLPLEKNDVSPDSNFSSKSHYFATPTNSSKRNNVSKVKNYSVPEESYVIPSADIFESESSDIPESVVEVPITSTRIRKRKKSVSKDISTLCLSDDKGADPIDGLIMTNVVGIEEAQDSNKQSEIDHSADVTSVVPKNSKRRKSNERLNDQENEINKFYNTVYNRNFDHLRLKNQMPKDKDLWKIIPADRKKPGRFSVICGFCNKTGHRSEVCYKKPLVCCICGATGHKDTRCPNKLCLNCGSPNNTFSVDCNTCKSWKNIYCGTCKEHGHPCSRCPDVWRRYHLTVKNEVPLVEGKKRKPKMSLHCSGCTKKGHLINDCKNYINFSNFKPASPYIFYYTPVYTPDAVRNPSPVNIVQISKLEKIHDLPDKSSTKAYDDKVKYNVKDSNSKIFQTPEADNKSKNKKEYNNRPEIQCKDDSELKISNLIAENGPKSFGKESDLKLKNDCEKIETKDWNQPGTLPTPQSYKQSTSTSESTPKSITITVSSSSGDNISRSVTVVESYNQNTISDKRIDAKQCNTINEEQAMPISCSNFKENESDVCKSPIWNKASSNVVNCGGGVNKTSILLSHCHGKILSSDAGGDFLSKLMQEHNVIAASTTQSDGMTLTLSGNSDKLISFQNDLLIFLQIRDTPVSLKPRNFIPVSRKKAIEKLNCEINSLSKNLGNPMCIYQIIKQYEDSMKRLTGENSSLKLNNKTLNKNYRLLNMILCGQARLANGNEAFKKMCKKLTFLKTQNYKALSDKQRDELGTSYCVIFSPCPRNDYPELINMYYKSDKIVDSPKVVETFLPENNNQSDSGKVSKKMWNKGLDKKCVMSQGQLTLLFRETTDEYRKFKDNLIVWGKRRFVNSLNKLIDMEQKLIHGKLQRGEIERLQKTLNGLQYFIKKISKESQAKPNKL